MKSTQLSENEIKYKIVADNAYDWEFWISPAGSFKLYNDTYGHLAGDDCLRQMAKTLEETLLRPADLDARYGSEEFACILPETDLSGATVIAYRMKENVEALNIPHSSSPAAPYVTISLGTTTVTARRNLSPDALIGTADRLLYQAKANGRNCVVAMRQD